MDPVMTDGRVVIDTLINFSLPTNKDPSTHPLRTYDKRSEVIFTRYLRRDSVRTYLRHEIESGLPEIYHVMTKRKFKIILG